MSGAVPNEAAWAQAVLVTKKSAYRRAEVLLDVQRDRTDKMLREYSGASRISMSWYV